MTSEIWKVKLQDDEYGTKKTVYLPATSAAMAETNAIKLALKDKDNFKKPLATLCEFQFYLNILTDY